MADNAYDALILMLEARIRRQEVMLAESRDQLAGAVKARSQLALDLPAATPPASSSTKRAQGST